MDKHDLRPEYDLEQLGPGVRGKHAKRYGAGTHVVLIDPDLAEVFPDSAAVNEALRELLARRERGGR